jgi:hypothetical protein
MLWNLVCDVTKSVLKFVDVVMLVPRKCFFVDFEFLKLFLGEWLEETSFGIGECVILGIDGLDGHSELSELSVRVGRLGPRLELLDDGSHCLLVLVS